jgi:hypothetical protein
MRGSDAHKLLDRFMPFEEYERRVEMFFAEEAQEDKREDGILLVGLRV